MKPINFTFVKKNPAYENKEGNYLKTAEKDKKINIKYKLRPIKCQTNIQYQQKKKDGTQTIYYKTAIENQDSNTHNK